MLFSGDRGGRRHYEILVSVIVISLVGLVFYTWIEKLAVKVERSKIQYMLSNINSTIKIQELSRIVDGRAYELADYDLANPMDFFDKLPEDYLGELNEGQDIKKGNWFYDPAAQQLVYAAISIESNKERSGILKYQLRYMNDTEEGLGRLRLIEVRNNEKDRDE